MNAQNKNKPTKRRKRQPLKKERIKKSKVTIITSPQTSVLSKIEEVYNWGLLDLNIPSIHKKERGKGIKIGVIDSGVPDHFDLVNQIKDYSNFSSSDTHLDTIGHATMICGIIAAEHNDKGIIGVAPESQLYIAKALDNNGKGTPEQLKKAFEWLCSKQVNIISISAGFAQDYPPLHDVIKQSFQNGVITVAAAGNAGKQMENVYYPARYQEVIGVAAYDNTRTVTDFSSRGVNVAFAMPGKDIYSTYLNNSFAKASGSSFACPILTGICALILSGHIEEAKTGIVKTPCTNTTQMMEHLVRYSIKLGTKEETGFGTIDVESLFSTGI